MDLTQQSPAHCILCWPDTARMNHAAAVHLRIIKRVAFSRFSPSENVYQSNIQKCFETTVQLILNCIMSVF
ncbi:hypothetical protein HHUSO_G25510 [Huso huso]|uniref:Uncharacterized protein n=1 Tax=Huso huso TaxID=61971 RepID=A0ABR0YR15_HUSHU